MCVDCVLLFVLCVLLLLFGVCDVVDFLVFGFLSCPFGESVPSLLLFLSTCVFFLSLFLVLLLNAEPCLALYVFSKIFESSTPRLDLLSPCCCDVVVVVVIFCDDKPISSSVNDALRCAKRFARCSNFVLSLWTETNR